MKIKTINYDSIIDSFNKIPEDKILSDLHMKAAQLIEDLSYASEVSPEIVNSLDAETLNYAIEIINNSPENASDAIQLFLAYQITSSISGLKTNQRPDTTDLF